MATQPDLPINTASLPCLENIPPELKLEILSYLPLSALASLCRCSGELYTIAKSCLYERVTFYTDCDKNLAFLTLTRASPNSINQVDAGLIKHFRVLGAGHKTFTLKEGWPNGECDLEEQLEETLHWVHRDQLLSFEWDTGYLTKPGFFDIIISQQSNLTTISVGLSCCDDCHKEEEEGHSLFGEIPVINIPNLKRLRIQDLCDVVGVMEVWAMLTSAKSLTHFALEFSDDYSCQRRNIRHGLLDEDKKTVESVLGVIDNDIDLLPKAVFRTLSEKHKLISLELCDVFMTQELRGSVVSDTLRILKIRNCKNLKSLQLQTHQFFLHRLFFRLDWGDLSSYNAVLQNVQPGLEELIFVTEHSSSEKMLQKVSFGSPRNYRFDYGDFSDLKDELPSVEYGRRRYLMDPESISRHSGTLKYLTIQDINWNNVESGIHSGHTMKAEESFLRHLCLEEYSITFDSNLYCNESAVRKFEILKLKLGQVTNLSRLKVLHLQSGFLHREIGEDTGRHPIPSQLVAQALKAFLEDIYSEYCTKPALRYVVIDRSFMIQPTFRVTWVQESGQESRLGWVPSLTVVDLMKEYPLPDAELRLAVAPSAWRCFIHALPCSRRYRR